MPTPTDPILVVGDGDLAHDVEATLVAAGAAARWLHHPVDRELRRAFADGVAAAIVIHRDDFAALRTALLVEHLAPGIRLIVTIFDRTVADQVKRAIPNCTVLSMADASIGALCGPCLGPDTIAARRGTPLSGVVDDGSGPRVRPLRPPGASGLGRLIARLRGQLRPHDRTTQLLLASLAGLVGVTASEVALSMLVGHEPFVAALYASVKSLATVGPNPVVDHGPDWLKLYSAVAIASALALMAVFTAALVGRLLSPRLTGIVGRLTIPRADHVVVVGLGQVGLRLCLELRALGVAVVAVEQDPDAAHVRLARRLELPVVIGRGGDRFILERLSLGRARALAAVTSDELTNIAVSVTALAVAPQLRTVLRAGSNDVTRETQVLFPIGVARDVHRIAAVALAANALDHDVVQAFVHEGTSYVQHADGAIERFPAPRD